jgi:hypothetical protein
VAGFLSDIDFYVPGFFGGGGVGAGAFGWTATCAFGGGGRLVTGGGF